MTNESKQISLLHIESDISICNQVTPLLSNKVDVLTTINDVKEGYEKFTKLQPNIIITALHLHQISTLPMIEKIIKINPQIPIIIAVNSDEIEPLKKAIDMGIDNYILKPVKENLLSDKLDKIIERLNNKETIEEQNKKIKTYLNFIEKKISKLKPTDSSSSENKIFNQNKTAEMEFLFSESQRISNMGTWKQDHGANELYWSEELYHILEINPENSKASYETLLSSIIPQDRSKVDKVHKEALKENTIQSIDYTILTNQGEQKLVNEKIQTLFDKENKALFTIGTIQNISQYKQLYENLSKNEEIMLAQSRFATMGEMISMIAHQWRQPITTISMSANNLLADIELEMLEEETVKKSSITITEQTLYLSKTIDDFRSFFKNVKQIEQITMEALFNETSKIMLMSLKNKEIDFKLNFDKDITIKTYARELLQVLINIIKNAKDALTEKPIKNKFIEVCVKQADEKIEILILDNAGGIKEENISKIFDAYFTTKDDSTGTGLGLYMSKTIVEEHHKGKLYVNNQSSGVCFTIELGNAVK